MLISLLLHYNSCLCEFSASNSEAIVYHPLRLGDVVLVQILLRVVPAHSVERILNLEDHGRERAHSRQVALSIDAFVVRVEHEGSICTVLLIESTEDEYGRGINLVSHSEIAWHPVCLVLDIDFLPDVTLNIVAFAHIRDLLW